MLQYMYERLDVWLIIEAMWYACNHMIQWHCRVGSEFQLFVLWLGLPMPGIPIAGSGTESYYSLSNPR